MSVEETAASSGSPPGDDSAPAPEGGAGAGANGAGGPQSPAGPPSAAAARPALEAGGANAKQASESPGSAAAASGNASGKSDDAVQNDTQIDDFAQAEDARRSGRNRFDRSAAAFGPDAQSFYFENVTQHFVDDRQINVTTARIRESAQQDFLESYVRVSSWDAMTRAFGGDEHLVVVYGPPGSGRHATAVNLLNTVQVGGWLGLLETEPDALGALFSRSPGADAPDSPIAPDDRLIIDLQGRPPTENQWRTIANEARTNKAYVVVVASEATGPYPLDLTACANVPPAVETVFEKNLAYRLKQHRESCTRETCPADSDDFFAKQHTNPQAIRLAQLAGALHEIGELARELVRYVHEPPEKITDLLAQWRVRLRRRAADLLAVRSPAVGVEAGGAAQRGERSDRLLLRRQVFRLSFAVFQEHPLSDVFAAGSSLLAHVTQVPQRRVTLAEMPLLIVDGEVRELLGEDMAPTEAVAADTGPRRAQLMERELVNAILDVAWHDYSTFREPLVAWLDELVRWPNVRVRVRAAQTAGLLAQLDYDEVRRRLIARWAAGPAYTRAAAADALDIAAREESIAPRVRDRIADWAQTGSPLLQDTAARAYGSAFGVVGTTKAIAELRDLGSRRALIGWNSVALALVQLSIAGASDEVVGALTEWIGSTEPNLRSHAVRAFLMLVHLDLELGRDRTLDELAHTRDGRETLVKLWRGALVDGRTSRRAWLDLGKWLSTVDERPELAEYTEAIAAAVLADSGGRARFWLRVWAGRHPHASIFGRITLPR
ncbi:hypothetical protein [Cryptosporangium minutisporangium]|uniref:Uncharacterized protein n=1 Tax=Cryptosporangium minutisporangium TaxID=113569 RepID=A0ABP6STI9_9ACTN